ncbi:MAG: hypothetical protein V4438_00755 [Patescibacteria group bacterium]
METLVHKLDTTRKVHRALRDPKLTAKQRIRLLRRGLSLCNGDLNQRLRFAEYAADGDVKVVRFLMRTLYYDGYDQAVLETDPSFEDSCRDDG